MRIGILGTGNMAAALGGAWVGAAHEVLVGGRDPAKAAAAAGRIGAAGHGTLADAAGFGDVVLVAVPACGGRGGGGRRRAGHHLVARNSLQPRRPDRDRLYNPLRRRPPTAHAGAGIDRAPGPRGARRQGVQPLPREHLDAASDRCSRGSLWSSRSAPTTPEPRPGSTPSSSRSAAPRRTAAGWPAPVPGGDGGPGDRHVVRRRRAPVGVSCARRGVAARAFPGAGGGVP